LGGGGERSYNLLTFFPGYATDFIIISEMYHTEVNCILIFFTAGLR